MVKPLDVFRALADPTRLRIMALLRAMELAVGELAQVLGQSQPRVSRHVKILCDAGLARRRKEGSWVFLVPGDGPNAQAVFDAIDGLNGESGGDHWAVADAAKLTAVRADRVAAAEAYFAAHAANWDAMRSLYVAEAQVEAAMRALLSAQPLGQMVDIGTGTGRMIEMLGGLANRVIGVDRSPEMLRLARAKLSESGLRNWELTQGDIATLTLPSGGADTVLVHQVLHYLPAPGVALAEAARLLRPGGRLLVVDFAPHDHEELRLQDAHARLGFSDDQMRQWYQSLGLAMTAIEQLEGGALTVKLWLGTRTAASPLKVVA